jgi:hydrogenase-4 component B
LLALDWVIVLIGLWLALALCGLAAPNNLRWVSHTLFPVGALVSLGLAAVALGALNGSAQTAVLILGMPDLPFHLRLDALAAFFLLLLGIAGFGISLFSSGYFRRGEGTPPGLLCLQYHLFLAAMAGVILADDAYLFMVAWETMALSSYFLVTSNHKIAEIRSAGFLYLLIAHAGAVAILLCFGILQSGGDYTFAGMRATAPAGFWPSVSFLLALFGFGAKAGILPLHAWLPEAHPAAPSPVSALMSGVMLKTAIYGLLRVTFDLLHTQLWWWGAVALLLGLLTALFGVLFAAVQTDMKRLLAYSSIENIGLIVVGVGLTLIFHAYRNHLLAGLALTASLYHCLNHACFKSLLFLATGAVLHATQERSLGKLGGLINRMPWVAGLALIGTLAIAGLPPLNGFVSEWLLLQVFLLTQGLPNPYLNMLIPISAAAVVLAAGLAGYVMVKFYGVIFLGQPREPKLVEAHDAGIAERIGMGWLAAACIILGLIPTAVMRALDPVVQLLISPSQTPATSRYGWLILAPVSAARASYSPLLFLLCVCAAVGATFWIVRKLYHGRERRAAPWDCGFALLNPRMQDTAEGFGQPIKQIFEPFFRIERHSPSPFDAKPFYRSSVEDRLWYGLYQPIARLVDRMAALIGVLQHGRIHIYLLYSFATLIVLLVFV